MNTTYTTRHQTTAQQKAHNFPWTGGCATPATAIAGRMSITTRLLLATKQLQSAESVRQRNRRPVCKSLLPLLQFAGLRQRAEYTCARATVTRLWQPLWHTQHIQWCTNKAKHDANTHAHTLYTAASGYSLQCIETTTTTKQHRFSPCPQHRGAGAADEPREKITQSYKGTVFLFPHASNRTC